GPSLQIRRADFILMLHRIFDYGAGENYHTQVEGGLLGDITDWGFSDPIWAYSNVSTGAGVVCAQTSISYVINLKDYFEKLLYDYPHKYTN
ncbi:MAG: hypothetical protein J1E95_11015, partial [Muribaculaceae bacterium]|nr:hypothetical protein [Muribaculaceae bacterium]